MSGGRKTSDGGEQAEALDKARQTQAERREISERAILEAAKIIVAEKGIEALTLHGAGEAAGYSRALPGHYFGTKNAMVAALVGYILESYAVRIRKTVQQTEGLDALCDHVSFYIDDGLRDPVSLRAFLNILSAGAGPTELAQNVARITREAIDGIADLIKRAREKG
ncbi:MAG: TetR/AcrR family transcriptional regulator, partial [Burkholderiales bacterium]